MAPPESTLGGRSGTASTAPKVKPTNPVQKACLVLAHAFAVTSLALTIKWAKGTDTKLNYLGGLDWSDKGLVFNYHPVLMVAGLVFCASEALLSYRTWHLGKQKNKALHLLWQTAAIVCLSVGLRAVFKNHALNHMADLYTPHAWLGIAVVTLYCANYVVGVCVFALPYASLSLRQGVLPYHVGLGLFGYVASILTAASGVVEKLAFKGHCQATPGVSYADIAEGCLLGNWLTMCLVCTALFTFLALYDGPRTPPPPPPSQTEPGRLEERLLGQGEDVEGQGHASR